MAGELLVLSSILFGIIAMAGYGIENFAFSLLSKRENAVRMMLWYFVITSLVLGALALAFFKFPAISPLDLALLLIIPFICIGAQWTFYRGLRVGKVALVAPVSESWPIIAVLFGIVFLGEGVGYAQGVGIVLAIVGTVLVSFRLRGLIRLKFGRLVKGMRYALLTMVGWSAFYLMIAFLSRQLGWLWAVVLISIGSALVALAHVLLSRGELSFPARSSKLMFWYIALGSVAFLAFSLGTNTGYISLVSPIAAASPFITVLLARAILKEKLDTNQIVGIGCVLIGLIAMAL
jgi:drug/metabolite transporter (DMT)-like permease